MAVSYESYRIFYHVAACESFTAAARILHNSQPNITRIIGQMERELGCPLFYRGHQGISLTREGEILYSHVQEAVRHINCAEEALKNQSAGLSGRITIAASETALHGVLLPILADYRRDYPGVQVNLHSMSTEDALESLKHQLVDFAVTTRPAHANAALSVTELAVFPDVFIAPERMQIPPKKLFSLQEVATWPLISMHRNSASYEMLRIYFSQHGILFQPGTFVSSFSQIIPMVSCGLGCAFLPSFMAREQLEKGRIRQISLREELPSHAICVITQESQIMNAACSELLRRLTSQTKDRTGNGW